MSRIYVGRVSNQAREKDLERFVRDYGKVREITLKNGYGFVEFDDCRDADEAVYALNGKEFFNERVIVELARGPRMKNNYRDDRNRDMRRPPPRKQYGRGGPPTRTDYRVLVENLSSRVSWQDLKDYMRQAGEVSYSDAHKLKKNEGIVEFETYEDMNNAIRKLDDTELNGRRIRMVEQYSKLRSYGRRSGSREGGRRRDRSYSPRSRSRSRGGKRRSSPSPARSSRSRDARSPSRDARSADRSDAEMPTNGNGRGESPASQRSD